MSTATRDRKCVATGLAKLDFLWLELTGHCNLFCTHCYAESSPIKPLLGEMSHDDWVAILDQAAELGCRQVQFIGGEPTYYPKLQDLIEHASDLRYELIEVFTNATHLSQKLIETFHTHDVHVATSFYCDDPAIHDCITRSNGSWHKTVSGIKMLLAADIPLRVGVIEMLQNAGTITQTVSFLSNLGVVDIGADHRRAVGRSKDRISESDEVTGELCGQCWRGRLCVAATGEVYPCVMARSTRLGTAKDGLFKIVCSDMLRDFRIQVRQFDLRRSEKSGRAVVEDAASRDFIVAAEPCWPNATLPPRPQPQPVPPPCAPSANPGPHGPH